jgi:hypothetical protein
MGGIFDRIAPRSPIGQRLSGRGRDDASFVAAKSPILLNGSESERRLAIVSKSFFLEMIIIFQLVSCSEARCSLDRRRRSAWRLCPLFRPFVVHPLSRLACEILCFSLKITPQPCNM